MTEEPTSRRQQLGRELRRARTAAGLTQSHVATVLGVTQAKINKIETTLIAIKPSELEQLIGLYDIQPDRATLLVELARHDLQEAPERTSWSPYLNLIEIEKKSDLILSWHSERIPGLLQSDLYVIMQYEASGVVGKDATALLRHRSERRKIFDGLGSPQYRAILSESSLRRMPRGRSAVAIDQCAHLIAMMEQHTNIDVHILTFEADVPYVDSDFILLYSKNSTEGVVAYIEYIGSSRILRKRSDLHMMRDFWDMLHSVALSREDTIKYLEEFGAQLRRSEGQALPDASQ